jgi:hypothetical protein
LGGFSSMESFRVFPRRRVLGFFPTEIFRVFARWRFLGGFSSMESFRVFLDGDF